MGRTGEAIAAYQQAVKLKPVFVEIYAPLGMLLLQSGRTTEFRQLVDELNRINPLEARKLSQQTIDMSP
jgi:cytochrome c-type biogenesis protein CcmH/NrfG